MVVVDCNPGGAAGLVAAAGFKSCGLANWCVPGDGGAPGDREEQGMLV